MPRIAVIGSGISGLAAAFRLATSQASHGVCLIEATSHFGGHANTLELCLDDVSHGVDTGFLVFNHRTYPMLTQLFSELNVETAPSEMSFSVQVPSVDGRCGLEWSGSSLGGVFAQRRNLLRPRFIGMLLEILRFNRLTTDIAERQIEAQLNASIEDFLDQHGFGKAFRSDYLLPMIGCIWSCPTDQMLKFPVATMIRFCHNHGLIQVANRPQWWTVTGGARNYVEKILAGVPDKRLNTPVRRIERDAAGVRVSTDQGTEHFDHVVLATHSDQSLALLAQPTAQEREVLGAIRYQPNRAVLHTDTRVMPRRRAAWAAWNYERAADGAQESARVCLHYWINRLQPLPFAQPVLVSLNPVSPIDPAKILGEFDYDHPVFDLSAWSAQKQVAELQGVQRTWFAGAWTGYGFHEDGLQSGYRAADALLAQMRMRYREAA